MEYIIPVGTISDSHWKMIIQMVEENYITEENKNSLLIIGTTRNNSVQQVIDSDWAKQKYFDRVIVYQLEPLVANHYWPVENMIKNLEGADEVWDYDLHNIEILAKYKIDAKFRPMKYTKSLRVIPDNIEKDIDVLFYGTSTPHRQEMLHYFMHYGGSESNSVPKFVWLHGFNDEILNNFIARSKIVLSLNTWGTPFDRQAQTRIFYLLINQKCVLAEKSVYNYCGDSIYQFQGWEELVHQVHYLLSTGKWADTSNITFGKE